MKTFDSGFQIPESGGQTAPCFFKHRARLDYSTCGIENNVSMYSIPSDCPGWCVYEVVSDSNELPTGAHKMKS